MELLWYALTALFLFLGLLGLHKKAGDAAPETTSVVTQCERSAGVGGDVSGAVVTGDNNREEATNLGDSITVKADEDLYRRLLGSQAGAPPPGPDALGYRP